MLLSSSFHPQQAAPVAAGAMPSFTTNDGLWRDLDASMSMIQPQPSLSRRGSVRAPVARPNSMRIVKPNQNGGGSLNSSPLHANAHMFAKPMLNRRQTVMGDNSYRRKRLIEATAASSMAQAMGQPQMRLRAGTTQMARPMSWHPVATNDGNMDMSNWQAMSAYSSPMSMEYQMALAQQSQMNVPNYIQQQPQQIHSNITPNYSPLEHLQMQQQQINMQNMYGLSHAHPAPNMSTFVPSQPVTPSLFPTQNFPMEESYAPYPYNNLVANNVSNKINQIEDWSLYNTLDVPSSNSNFYSSGSTTRTNSASTAPPTPESFPSFDNLKYINGEQEKEWNVEVDKDDDSEVLVGMGLYDSPEKGEEQRMIEYGPVVSMSRFGRGNETSGKGLKLEETWEPPAAEDEEEQDAEGEEEDEPEQVTTQMPSNAQMSQAQVQQMQMQQMVQQQAHAQGQMMQVAGWV